MLDQPIRWTAAGACLEVARSRDGLTVVADPDGPARRTAELTTASLADFGPAVVSPSPGDSIGLWLHSSLEDDAMTATWRVVAADGSSFDVAAAAGRCRLVCRGLLARSGASLFRHDAHSLLNAIGMNADLVGMLLVPDENPKIEAAVARIRTSCDALGALISSRTRELESGGSLPVVVALEEALRRAGIEGVSRKHEESADAPLLWCLAAGRLLVDWVGWLTAVRAAEDQGRGKGGVGYGSPGGLELSCDRHAVGLAGEVPPLSGASSVFDVLKPGNAAAPELQPAEPVVVLGGMRVGFGSWQARGAAGVCIGIPASS